MTARLVGLIDGILAEGPVRSFFARGSTLLTGQIVAALMTFGETILLARALGPEVYGQLALVIATVLVVLLVIDVRVWETATRFGVEFLAHGERDKARAVLDMSFVVNAAAGLLAGGVIVLLAHPVAAALVDGTGAVGAVRLYAVVAPFYAIVLAAAGVLRVLDAYRMLTWLTVVVPALRAVAAGLSLGLGLQLMGTAGALMGAEVVGSSIFVAATWWQLRRRLPAEVPFRTRVGKLRSHVRAMGRFMALSTAVGSLRVLNERGDLLLVGALASPSTVGIFKMARTFTQPLGLFIKPYFQVIYPQLTHAASRGDLRGMRRLAYRSMTPMAAILVPMALITCALGPFLIPLFAGSAFADSAEAVIPMAVGWAISGVFFWVYAGALALDAQKVALAALVAASVLQFALLLVLVPVLGATGAGLAWMSFSAGFAIVMFWAMHRRLRLPSGTQGAARSA